MDAFERRFVALLDVPSAYFHAKAGRVKSFIKLQGILVDLFIQAEQSAKKKVTRDKKGRKVLYTRMNKALYGHIMSGRLFWEHLSLTLVNLGFVANPDDLCILNKEINGCLCTVVLHVDDIKMSHVEERVVREVASQLEVTYGPMELRCDDVLHYCGLTLDYREDGCVKIGAEDHILETLHEFPEDVGQPRKTPATKRLFEVNETCEKLDEGRRKMFHSTFAKLLWIGKKARPDILVALSFLGKRTEKADQDD